MSDDEVKAGMTRRMNVMFAALKEVEWSVEGNYDNFCPACGARQDSPHQNVNAGHIGGDSLTQPCPIAFALSEAAYAEPGEPAVVQTFPDGSRFLHRDFWAPVHD